jgi:hypothetical protein
MRSERRYHDQQGSFIPLFVISRFSLAIGGTDWAMELAFDSLALGLGLGLRG